MARPRGHNGGRNAEAAEISGILESMFIPLGYWFDSGLSYVQTAKAYLFIAAVLAFLVSGYYSYNEARYLLFGKGTVAVLMEHPGSVGTRMVSTNSRGQQVFVAVKYAFKDTDGTVRSESDRVSEGWHEAHREDFEPVEPENANAAIAGNNGLAVPIQYIPGSVGSSRLAGHHHLLGTIPFLLSTAAVIGFGAWVWRDVQAFERHKALKEHGELPPVRQGNSRLRSGR